MVIPRPSISGDRDVYTFSGMKDTGIPRGTGPNLLNTSYTITADVHVPEGGAEGMIVTDGGRFGGYGFYLLKGKPVFLWNLLDLKRVRWEGPDALTPAKHTLVESPPPRTAGGGRPVLDFGSSAQTGSQRRGAPVCCRSGRSREGTNTEKSRFPTNHTWFHAGMGRKGGFGANPP
jgi:hypothetical protein